MSERKKSIENGFTEEMSAMAARGVAQQIAFAPFVFQGVRVLVVSGILQHIKDAGEKGLIADQIQQSSELSAYAVTVLLEMGLAAGVLGFENDQYHCTKVGWFLLKDELTRVNMNFTHSVCYKGLYHLEEALRTGTPAGLKELGDWDTVYEGLSMLPDEAKKDWFAFDHYYSDHAFPKIMPILFGFHPERILDIGGNTGKFATALAKFNEDVRVTICDLPGQLRVAYSNLEAADLLDRVGMHPVNLLSEASILPSGHDTAWMSQFLCCFSEDQIVQILRKVKDAVGSQGSVFIMDTFWDRQKHSAAAYSLIATSLYFTAIANGTSRMYKSDAFFECIHRAGLQVVEEWDDIGLGHTLLRCAAVH